MLKFSVFRITLSALLICLSASMSCEVVVLGSTAIDFVAYTSALPQKGETVFGTSFAKNFGGKGANQVHFCLFEAIESHSQQK